MAMSPGRPNHVKNFTWQALLEERSTQKQKESVQREQKETPEAAEKIQQLNEEILLRPDGFKILSAFIAEKYPNISETTATIQANKNKDQKQSTGLYSTATSYLSYVAQMGVTAGKYVLKYSVNDEQAAEAKLIADNFIKTATADKKETLEALQKLRVPFNKLTTAGTTYEAMKLTFESYGFSADEHTFQQQFFEYTKSQGLVLLTI